MSHWVLPLQYASTSLPYNLVLLPVNTSQFVICKKWKWKPCRMKVNDMQTTQLTCLVVSDNCCSILSTTFLKGGLLKGSASQQDLIIWYLHNNKQKHFSLSAVQIVLSSTSNVWHVSCRSACEKPIATAWEQQLLFKSPTLIFFLINLSNQTISPRHF